MSKSVQIRVVGFEPAVAYYECHVQGRPFTVPAEVLSVIAGQAGESGQLVGASIPLEQSFQTTM